jgi:hypothetical protein
VLWPYGTTGILVGNLPCSEAIKASMVKTPVTCHRVSPVTWVTASPLLEHQLLLTAVHSESH